MGVKRKQCTKEFKVKAVRVVDESGRSKVQIARELRIHETQRE